MSDWNILFLTLLFEPFLSCDMALCLSAILSTLRCKYAVQYSTSTRDVYPACLKKAVLTLYLGRRWKGRGLFNNSKATLHLTFPFFYNYLQVDVTEEA